MNDSLMDKLSPGVVLAIIIVVVLAVVVAVFAISGRLKVERTDEFGVSIQESQRSCEEYKNLSISRVPARCVSYFNERGEEKP